MNIAIFSKSLQAENVPYVQQIIDELESRKSGIYFYKPFFEKIKENISIKGKDTIFESFKEIPAKIDCLFSIGGDGTLLDTISLVQDSGIPILGINLGRMGFLSSISKERINQAIDKLLAGKFKLDKRALIKLESDGNLFGDMNYALNEVSIYRKSPLSMLKIQAYINGEFLNSYWADGLIVATPTGSTAYSLSNNGPIILPGSQNFIISPIASHNLTVRPIVIPDDSAITLKVVGRIKEFYINLDSRSAITDSSVDFSISREKFRINLIQLEGESYFKTIREKLLWGLDIRN